MGRPPHDLDDYLEWQQRLENQKESGLSVDVFCLQEGVSRSTYYRWVRQLQDGIPQSMLEEQAEREKAETGEAVFLPITLKASPVEIELPNGGKVTFYSGPTGQPVTLAAPAMAGVAVGHVYRLRISELPEHPGIELFPSIEILDRLHPPNGKLYEFPIPVQITTEEIQFALAGNLVTKVMYLEQPQLAIPRPRANPIGVDVVPAHRNAFAEADRRGRPTQRRVNRCFTGPTRGDADAVAVRHRLGPTKRLCHRP